MKNYIKYFLLSFSFVLVLVPISQAHADCPSGLNRVWTMGGPICESTATCFDTLSRDCHPELHFSYLLPGQPLPANETNPPGLTVRDCTTYSPGLQTPGGQSLWPNCGWLYDGNWHWNGPGSTPSTPTPDITDPLRACAASTGGTVYVFDLNRGVRPANDSELNFPSYLLGLRNACNNPGPGPDAGPGTGGENVGVCGNANGKTYASTRTSYAPDEQCYNGTSDNTAFPHPGNSTSWLCVAQNGNGNVCTARRDAAGPDAGSVPPHGTLDVADCSDIIGWAYDPDTASSQISVKIYDGSLGTLLGTIATDVSRPDVNSAMRITGNHGFYFATPTSIKNGANHSIYVYGVDSATGNPTLLNLAPKTINCARPSMTGTLTAASNSCTIASGARSCTIPFSWTTTNPQGISAVTSDTSNTGANAPNTNVANGNNGGPTPFTIPYPGRSFFLYNNAIQLAQAFSQTAGGTIRADCEAGTAWDGEKCSPNTNTNNGVWSAWGAWGACGGATCGQTGTQTQTRTCTRPQNSGTSCVGPSTQSRSCTMPACTGTAPTLSSPINAVLNGVIRITSGAPVTLEWSSNATSCTSNTAEFVTHGAPNGRYTIPHVYATTTYTVTCGGIRSNEITVRIIPGGINN